MTGQQIYNTHRTSWLEMTNELLPVWEALPPDRQADFNNFAVEQSERDSDVDYDVVHEPGELGV